MAQLWDIQLFCEWNVARELIDDILGASPWQEVESCDVMQWRV